jgi:hypothetical protein
LREDSAQLHSRLPSEHHILVTAGQPQQLLVSGRLEHAALLARRRHELLDALQELLLRALGRLRRGHLRAVHLQGLGLAVRLVDVRVVPLYVYLVAFLWNVKRSGIVISANNEQPGRGTTQPHLSDCLESALVLEPRLVLYDLRLLV